MHDVISVGLPMIAILAGILFNRSDARELRNEMRSEIQKLSAKVEAVEKKIDTVKSDLDSQIDTVKNKLDSKIDENRDAAHRDTLEILKAMTSLHERVAIVEDRQGR